MLGIQLLPQHFTVTSNITWTASDDAAWLTLSGVGTGTLTANYDANTTVSSRVGTITLSGPGVSDVTLTVTQTLGQLTLTATPSNQNVGNSASSTTFTVTSNITWTASDQIHRWLTVPSGGTGSGTLTATYSCKSNNQFKSWHNYTLSGPGVSDVTLTVTQAAGSCDINCNSIKSKCWKYICFNNKFYCYLKYYMDSK